MSKKISYKGNIPDGLQDRIRLKTLNGKKGYKINKFQIIGTNTGATDDELTAQIFTKDQTGSITSTVDFTNSDLLAVAVHNDSINMRFNDVVIFDNEVFNQDIFITAVDVTGGTNSTNYYIELEVMTLTDLQATQLTLKNLRLIASR